MTDAEIADVVNLIVSTWPSGSKGNVWTMLLRDRNPDSAVALAAYSHLRDEDARPPSPARFLEAVRFVESGVRRASERPSCGTCRGTGYVDCRDDRRHGPGCRRDRDGSCFCSALDPCPDCSSGRPTPVRQDEPVSFEEYIRRCKLRRDFEEVARWERLLGHSLS